MYQYCVYCASCIEDENGLYCDKKEKHLTENQAKRSRQCADYSQSPMGHIRTGKQYRPQQWRWKRVYK